jgi:hypothetical protein
VSGAGTAPLVCEWICPFPVARTRCRLCRSQPGLSRREPQSAAPASERKLLAGASRLPQRIPNNPASFPLRSTAEVFNSLMRPPCTVILERQPAGRGASAHRCSKPLDSTQAERDWHERARV